MSFGVTQIEDQILTFSLSLAYYAIWDFCTCK